MIVLPVGEGEQVMLMTQNNETILTVSILQKLGINHSENINENNGVYIG